MLNRGVEQDDGIGQFNRTLNRLDEQDIEGNI